VPVKQRKKKLVGVAFYSTGLWTDLQTFVSPAARTTETPRKQTRGRSSRAARKHRLQWQRIQKVCKRRVYSSQNKQVRLSPITAADPTAVSIASGCHDHDQLPSRPGHFWPRTKMQRAYGSARWPLYRLNRQAAAVGRATRKRPCRQKNRKRWQKGTTRNRNSRS
jgi:hypothetical protein